MTEVNGTASNHSSTAQSPKTVPLSESEERFRLVLEASPDGFIILRSVRDAAGTIVDFQIEYTNPVAARGVNRTPEELYGQYLLRLFPDCQTSGIFDRYVTVAETGISTTFETFYDSTELAGWFRNVVVKLNDGIAVSFSNITDVYNELRLRKQAEQRRDVQYAIARILAEATTVIEAIPAILQALCENLGWQISVIWDLNLDKSALRAINCWQSPEMDLQKFVDVTQQTTFAVGIGLPGRVWASRQPHWISELSKDSNFPRIAIASQVGLQSGFGFPILLGNEILGVIECFSNRIQEPDTDLLKIMAAIGSQIGQFMERQRTETALRESQELFQSFMNNSPVAAFIKDEVGRYVYVNAWVERSQANLLGKTDFEILPPPIAQQFQTNDLAVLSSGQPMQMLETIQHEDGKQSDYLSFKFPLRNAAGQQLLAGVALDISDRIRAEEELRQREVELRLITNAVPVLISFIDAQQRYRFNNQKYEEWFGNPASEVYGKYMWEVLGEAAYATIRPYVEQVLAGQQVTFESKIPYKNGGTRFVSVTYVPRFDQQGNVKGFVALVSDISQRQQAEETLRQSEERLRIAQQAANAGMWDWDILTNQVTWSEEYYCLYGLNPATTQPSYENWLLSIVEQDRDRVDRAARSTLESRTDLNVEFRIFHPNRGERWLTAIGQTFYDDHGQPQRMTGIALDITERKLSEQALCQSEEQARLAIKVARLGTWRCDLQTNLVDLDKRMRQIWGEPDHAETIPLLRVMERIHPHDQQRVSVAIAAALAPESSEIYEIDYRIIWDDGNERWISATGQVQFEGEGESRQPINFVGTALDITEHKQAQEALRNNAERLSVALTAAKLGDWSWDAATDIVTFSERAAEIFAIPPGPYMTWTQMQGLLHEQDRERARLGVEQAVANQEDYDIEYRVIHPDGTLRWVAAKGRAQYDSSGQVLGMLGVVQDITVRKQAEAALQQSEAFNRQILESSEDCIKVLDLEGSLLYMNPGGQKLLKVNDTSSLLGHSWVKFWEEADHRAAQAALNKAKGGGVGTFQGYCPTLVGEPKWWDVQITPIKGVDGQVERLLCISRDITERKLSEAALSQSEERYRYLAESIPQLVWTANTEGVLIDLNQRWTNYTGLTLAQARTGGWQAVIHPDDIPILSQKWAIAQKDGTYYQAEGRMRRADGVYRWHLHQAVPLKNEQGQAIKWFGTATDIEDRKQLEQQRIHLLQQEQTAREQAEAANRIKDEFLAVLSHELRSPLNPILGWAKLLQTRPFEQSSAKRALETIERNAKLQTQLIDDLLDISRILRGKMVLNVCPVNLVEVIDAALETVRLSAEAKDIKFQKIVAGNIGIISGDSGRLQQIVWNLLSNAVKFTPNGGEITIHLQQVGSDAQIQVKDTGIGIKQEFLPHVFEYFRQADSTTTRKFGGLGLGLAIVRYFTELHGGTVKAESPGEGLGATFIVSLPQINHENTATTDKAESANAVADASPLANLRILVVDDEADMRDLIFTILQHAGAEVRVAASAVEALQAFDIFKPDVLISDIGMAEMDGYELMRQVRSLPPEHRGRIPAIALTAYAGEINQQQALAAGFHKHIAKPIEPDELIEAIVKIIRNS